MHGVYGLRVSFGLWFVTYISSLDRVYKQLGRIEVSVLSKITLAVRLPKEVAADCLGA